MHFAADICVPESVQNFKYYNNNTAKTMVSIDKPVRNGVYRLSSQALRRYMVCPRTLTILLKQYVTINPYGQSKLMVEHILKKVSDSIPAFEYIFRYFNVAGSHIDGKVTDVRWTEKLNVVPTFISRILSGSQIYVYGTNYNTVMERVSEIIFTPKILFPHT